MEIEETKKVLEKWASTISDMDKSCNALISSVGLNPDAPLIYAIETIQGEYTKAIANIVNDKTDLLCWYWLENDMGKKCMQAGLGEDLRAICNINDLTNLLFLYHDAKY